MDMAHSYFESGWLAVYTHMVFSATSLAGSSVRQPVPCNCVFFTHGQPIIHVKASIVGSAFQGQCPTTRLADACSRFARGGYFAAVRVKVIRLARGSEARGT